jgi:hypothetical protein
MTVVPFPHPWTLRLSTPASAKQLYDIDNGKTLNDLKFARNECVTIMAKTTLATSKMPMVDENG